MAPRTERRFTRDLMLDAVPNSSANIFATREIWSLGGMINDTMLVSFLGCRLLAGLGLVRACAGGKLENVCCDVVQNT